MKRFTLFLAACFCFINGFAAYLRDVPTTVTQPDGTVLHCFASGDEFFNYLHDANGYTIIQHPKTGYYVYADKRNGKLVATDFVAGKYNPASKNLKPYNLISPEEWIQKRKAWEVDDPSPKNRDGQPNHGTLNNIAIFIRFSDDGEFANTYSSIDNMFNDMSGNNVSMRSYFQSASYGAIDIPTTFYPRHNGETIISYQDNQPRSYFQPYNASTNTNGYVGDDQRRTREFDLLQRAVTYINNSYPIPTDLNIDFDNDGKVDNVCFIVKGDVGAWGGLLWPHKWSLYDRTVTINGKRVYTFNFQLADATDHFNTSTMCHEMNHSLGAPDLYHYSYSGPDPVGPWDLMNQNATPPQHCGAYMKMKYGHWIDEIPEITQAGTYTLNPISSAAPTNIAYKIVSSNPNQFYVVEYRDKNAETALPGSGLLIYRIDTRFDGNVNYDPDKGIYDEIYIFRPNGTVSNEGSLSLANFSADVNRTEFCATTSPYPFLSEGTLDENMRIYDITIEGNTASFKYGAAAQCEPPTNLVAAVNGRDVALSWDAAPGANSYRVMRDGNLLAEIQSTNYLDEAVLYGTHVYCVRSIDAEGNVSAPSNAQTITISNSGPVATDLTASLNGNSVNLSWTAPASGSAILQYGSGDPINFIGYGGAAAMYWAQRYPVTTLVSYAGMAIDKVSVYFGYSGTYTLYIYNGNETGTSDLLYQTDYTVSSSGWKDINVTNIVPLDYTSDLWVVMYAPQSIAYPAGYCSYSGSGVENATYYSNTGNIWLSRGGNTSWLMKTYISDGTFTYNLYDGTNLVASNIEGTSHTISNIADNAVHQYTVKTNYYGGESAASNMVGYAVGTASIASLEMTPNDKMTITEGSTLTVSGTLSSNEPGNLILENGAQLINSSTVVKATVKKDITPYTANDNGWYFIASPVTENLTASEVSGLLTNNFDLYLFDQSQASEWRNYEANSFSTLNHKTGYLYANSGSTTLTFAGTLAASANATTLAYDANAALKGFNLIGNPYPCNTTITNDFYIISGNSVTLAENGRAIAPCEGVFVKATGESQTVTFNKATSAKGAASTNCIDLVVSQGKATTDRARVRFGEGIGMEKFNLNEKHSQITLWQNGQDYAVAYADGVSEMPVSFAAAQDGTYSLSVENDGLDLDYLHLIDNMTGEDVDLLATPSYTFEAKTSDYPSRFRLLFAPEEAGASTGSATFAYCTDGEIIITGIADACNASLQVVDMMGRVVTTHVGRIQCVPTSGMTPGVYVLRLIDGETIQTQKIVLR